MYVVAETKSVRWTEGWVIFKHKKGKQYSISKFNLQNNFSVQL